MQTLSPIACAIKRRRYRSLIKKLAFSLLCLAPPRRSEHCGSVSKIHLPLAGRTHERTQGCWNCQALASHEDSLKRWLTVDRPAAEARIAQAKMVAASTNVDPAAILRAQNTGANAPCPCGSGAKYKRCHRDKDAEAGRVMKAIDGIAMATAHLERFEASIREGDQLLGNQALCQDRLSAKYDTFVSDKYLCDRWNARQGASVARAGQGPDKLPEELKDIHGDGN